MQFTGWAFLTLTVVMVVTVYLCLVRAIQAVPHWDGKKKKKSGLLIGIGVMGWFSTVLVLGALNLFNDFALLPPRAGVPLFASIPLMLVASHRPWFKEVLKAMSMPLILGLQGFRLVVELLLWKLFTDQIIPVQMTFEGLNFDVLIGVTGPILAVMLIRNPTRFPTVLMAWNIGGIILVSTIVTIAVLSMPTPLRVFMNEPSNTIVGQFPYHLLPTVLVPLAYGLHILSIRKLLLANKKG